MTLSEIQEQVMFQTNNDAEDVGDFEPYLVGYINDGYDRLLYAYEKVHPETGSVGYPLLNADLDKPKLPEWAHTALADWATWLVYRNGNPQKQQRGYHFRAAFDEIERRITSTGGKAGMAKPVTNFYNIP